MSTTEKVHSSSEEKRMKLKKPEQIQQLSQEFETLLKEKKQLSQEERQTEDFEKTQQQHEERTILQMVISIPSSEAREPRSHHKKTSHSEQTVVQSTDQTISSQEAISKSKILISKRPLSGVIIRREEIHWVLIQKPQTLSTSEAKTES